MLLAGELLKSAAFIAAGYLYANAIQRVSSIMQIVLWCVTGLIVIIVLIWYKRHGKNRI